MTLRLSYSLRHLSEADAENDTPHALEPGDRRPALTVPAAWLDPRHLCNLRRCQAIWDEASPEQREAARTRLVAINRFFELRRAGLSATDADAVAGREVGLSASTVRKWHGHYHGATPIERLVSLLDAAARRT